MMLDDDLRTALTGLDAAAALPPIATHLNADSSWLILIPIPAAALVSTRRRRYFSIVIDPWLVGPQADVTRFLSQQTHAIKSAYTSLAEVEKFVQEVEELLAGSEDRKTEEAGYIDLVVVSAEFTDHLHIETLKEIRKSVPVLAGGQKAITIIKAAVHFDTVIELPPHTDSSAEESSTASPVLPSFLSITRVVSASDALSYHSAVLITFLSSSSHLQSIIYTPHGLAPASLPESYYNPSASTKIETLALIHGLDSIRLWGRQLNMGAENGLALARKSGAKWYLRTHDEEKNAAGIVKYFLKRVKITFEDALSRETKVSDSLEGSQVKFVDVGNGENILLV